MDMIEDRPPGKSVADLQAQLDRGMADVSAGRVVPGETVMAELDASIGHLERRRKAKVTDAA